MARGIKKDEVAGWIRLHLTTRRAEIKHLSLARGEVLHREVKVDLLGRFITGPRRWLVVSTVTAVSHTVPRFTATNVSL